MDEVDQEKISRNISENNWPLREIVVTVWNISYSSLKDICD